MKKLYPLLIILAAILPLAGCRSHKQTPTPVEPQEVTWHNVQLPVTMTMIKPQKISVSGTATMVRGEYVYVSVRFWGFEVGQVNITPEEADVVLKQPQKLWMNTPVADRLARLNIPFTSLQEILLGNRDFLKKLPKGFNVDFGGSDSKPEVTVAGTFNGKEIEVMFTWNLGAAKWDVESPKSFTAPGTGYKKISFEEALKKFAPMQEK